MDVADSLRQLLRGRAGVRVAILFGSEARGKARADSDIDLAVLGDVDRLALAADLSDAMGREVQVVDLSDPRSRTSSSIGRGTRACRRRG